MEYNMIPLENFRVSAIIMIIHSTNNDGLASQAHKTIGLLPVLNRKLKPDSFLTEGRLQQAGASRAAPQFYYDLAPP